ncbi:hypothetical protein [Hathewaya limosa]|uniref:Uncharacterized protein n=1 Tax=Hathewaya limosa TaxID=1536 RepID=A0ABU0JUJ8_HATLI|nr:hypothetical protein [Hathewaya limosa]MDQ0480780.1 hypothetical protein [Hathewaya limosa]
MGEKILTIDLKNRTFKDSIILDLSDIKDKKFLRLNLVVEKSLNKIKNFLKDGELQSAKLELETIKPYFKENKDSEFLQEYNMYNEVCLILICAIKELYEDEDELNKFLKLSEIFHQLIIFKVSNDISYFIEFYDEHLIKLEQYVINYDLLKVLKNLKKQLDKGEKLSYVMEIVDKLSETYIYKDEEKKELEGLQHIIKELREDKIKTYNDGTKNDKLCIVKFLMPYRYRRMVKDSKFDEYVKILNCTYSDYEEIENDLYNMHKLYILNKSNTYEEFYKTIINFKHIIDFRLSEYASYYIIRRLFEKNKNYYSIKELEADTCEIMKLLKIKKNTNSIPV